MLQSLTSTNFMAGGRQTLKADLVMGKSFTLKVLRDAVDLVTAGPVNTE